MLISNHGTFPNKISLGSEWFQPRFFIVFHSQKDNCDKNKNKQYRNFIPIQYIESFKNQLEGMYILKC